MHRYAQIDETGTVIGVSTLSGEVDALNMILLDDTIEHINIGWKFIDGEFIEPISPEEPPLLTPEPEPSNAEIAKLMTDLYASLYIAGVI